ncbi:MAG: DUF4129 domain-containing protein [Chloroflexi bacterium]|nr:DUF4129 domain-containing protein [Chloroflexota bacterium]
MNLRVMATEATALLARVVWVYAGVAVVVAQLGEGQAISIATVTAVVVIAHTLARLLARIDMGQQALRFWGALISVALFFLVLRLEITGDPYLWELGWLGDLFTVQDAALEGHSGTVAAVILLAMAWVFGVARGSRPRTFEGLAGEVSAGLAVVLFAALFADAAGAPAVVSWLPIPYLATALVALAAVHFSAVKIDRGRPFAGIWWLGVVGSLVVIGAIALPTALIDLEALGFIGEGLGLLAKGIGIALVFALLPLLLVLVWMAENILNFTFDAEPFTPEMPTVDDLIEQQEEDGDDRASWTRVVGYILRFGLVALVVTLVMVLLWFAFQRIRKSEEDDVELREEVDAGAGGGLGSLLEDALGRLRGRFAGGGIQGRDAIGRLYFTMLRGAEAQGLLRPAAATPLEFAPSLVTHYASELPTAISHAYAVARYSGRPPRQGEVEELNSRWAELRGQLERDKPG